jgi:hypothetical protein
MRSRLALAASVGLLLLGSWVTSARLPEYGTVSVDPAPKNAGSASQDHRLLKPHKANSGSPNRTVAPNK